MCIASMVYSIVQVCVLNFGLLRLLDWQYERIDCSTQAVSVCSDVCTQMHGTERASILRHASLRSEGALLMEFRVSPWLLKLVVGGFTYPVHRYKLGIMKSQKTPNITHCECPL